MKLTIRRDAGTKVYWSLTNCIQLGDRGRKVKASLTRNTAALISSGDLGTYGPSGR